MHARHTCAKHTVPFSSFPLSLLLTTSPHAHTRTKTTGATSVGTVKYWTDRHVEDAVNCTTPGGTSTTFKPMKIKYDFLDEKNYASITLPVTAPSAAGTYTLWVLVNAECPDLITTNNADYVQFTAL